MASAAKKGEAAFFATHDNRIKIPRKIRFALDQMAKEGKDRWEYNDDFRSLAGMNAPQLKTYRAEFAKHLVWAPSDSGRKEAKLVWCAAPEQAQKFAKVPGAKKYDLKDDIDSNEG